MDSILLNNRQQFTKDSIAILADKARENIIQNKYLSEKINIFKQEITTIKNLMNNFWKNSNKKNINDKILSKYIEHLEQLNSYLKDDFKKNLNKLQILQKNSKNEFSYENSTLSQLSIDNFILKNTLIKLYSMTQSLNNSIEISKKYEIFRESKRENFIDIKQSKNVFPVCNLELQQKMLSYCRAYSKYRYKNAKKLIKINKEKQNILSLIEFIKECSMKFGEESLENKSKCKTINNNKLVKNLEINKISTKNGKIKIKELKRTKTKAKLSKKISASKFLESTDLKSKEQRQNSFDNKKLLNIRINDIFNSNIKMKKKENTEKKKINLLNIDELLDVNNIEVEDENIIDNELNSDDDVFFEKKIKPKKTINKEYISILRKDVPTINLSQIEFNKIKVINDADAYSFQKRKIEQNNINWQIKNLKKQIKNTEKQISINKNKLNVIHNFIEDVKYNYKLLRPIKVQSSAAGNPVTYIREKLLDIVGESISKVEKKEALGTGKKTEKTAVEEGGLDYDDEIVGSDYSDEDGYIDNYKDKGDYNEFNENKSGNCESNNQENKENKENNNNNIYINHKDNAINLRKRRKDKNSEIKNKNKDIKSNLLSKFNYEEEKVNSNLHDYFDDFKCSGALSK